MYAKRSSSRTPKVPSAIATRRPELLANLLDNAIKYSPDGGLIVEKFYRLDPNMTRGVGGSGLGLHVSRELIHQMHGRLTVTSSHGVGSTFSVILPLATREGDGRAPAEKSGDYTLAET
jgi:signal transduction histidine kinase